MRITTRRRKAAGALLATSALVVLAAKGGIDVDETRRRFPRVAEVPFDAAYKLMATFHEMDDESGRPVIRCFVKGAPDVLLARSSRYVDVDGAPQPIGDQIGRVVEENDRLASEGLRVLAVARRDVDPSLVDAATGIGMSRLARLCRVELPLAWPPILTGIRVSTQMLMGIAAIAAYASGPGLGNEIFRGIASLGSANAINQVLAGTLGIVVLALVLDGTFALIGRYTVSRGIRGQ